MSSQSSDFDARRIGWWQRRDAVRRLAKADWLTDADRALWIQQARAAQTRGEINALTRDSERPAPTLMRAPSVRAPHTPPTPGSAQLSPPVPPASSSAPAAGPRRGLRQQAARKGSVARTVGITLIIAFFAVGGAFVSCVSAIVSTVSDVSSGDVDVAAPDIVSRTGWPAMVEAFGDEDDVSQAVEVVVRQGTATVSLLDPADLGTVARYYYDGDVTPLAGRSRDLSQQPFDLDGVPVADVVDAVSLAGARSGAAEGSQPEVTVADPGTGPQITVTFTDGTAGAYRLVVAVGGATVSETL